MGWLQRPRGLSPVARHDSDSRGQRLPRTYGGNDAGSIAGDDIDDKVLKHYFTYSKLLAASHPDLLVEVTLKGLLGELPDDQEEREDREAAEASERRRQAEAKPEAERTTEDNRYLDVGIGYIGHRFRAIRR